MSITENVAHIRAEMEAAALSCGRDPREIKLCAIFIFPQVGIHVLSQQGDFPNIVSRKLV